MPTQPTSDSDPTVRYLLFKEASPIMLLLSGA